MNVIPSRFKSPHHTKPSIDPKKNQILSSISLLDKCTQILRDDRIWFRGQLKDGNQQVLAVFRSMKKPLNMQHLQIKLRKYLNHMKSRQKAEQLMKFKQSLSNNGCNYQPTTRHHQRGATSMSTKPNVGKQNRSSSNYQSFFTRLRSYSNDRRNSSSSKKSYNNTSNYKREDFITQNNSNSQKKTQDITQLAKNWKNNTNTFPTNYFSEAIQQQTERDSEYLTSYRNQNIQKSTKEQIRNQRKGPVEQSQEQIDEARQIQYHELMSKCLDQQFSSIQKQSQSQICFQKNQIAFQKPFNTKQAKQQHFQEKQFEKEQKKKYSQKKQVSKYSQQNYSEQKCQQKQTKIELPNSPAFVQFNDPVRSAQNSNLNSLFSSAYTYHPKQEPFKIQNTKTNVYSYQSHNEQNLFTSPQLLMECRKFLKGQAPTYEATSFTQSYQSKTYTCQPSYEPYTSLPKQVFQPISIEKPFMKSIQKQYICQSKVVDIPSVTKREDVCYDIFHKYASGSSKKPIEHQFDNTRSLQKSQKHLPEQNYSYKQFTQSQPQTQYKESLFNSTDKKDHNTKCQVQTTMEEIRFTRSIKNQEYHNMRQSLQNHVQQPNEEYIGSGQKQEKIEQFQEQEQEQEELPLKQTLQQMLDRILQLSEGNPYIQKQKLQVYPQLREFLRDQKQVVFIGRVGKYLNQRYARQKTVFDSDSVGDMYYLLDLTQKGWIGRQDVQEFLTQLQDGGIEDIQPYHKAFYRLFEIVQGDQSPQQIDFWGLYAVKQTQIFNCALELLNQFQFQVHTD